MEIALIVSILNPLIIGIIFYCSLSKKIDKFQAEMRELHGRVSSLEQRLKR